MVQPESSRSSVIFEIGKSFQDCSLANQSHTLDVGQERYWSVPIVWPKNHNGAPNKESLRGVVILPRSRIGACTRIVPHRKITVFVQGEFITFFSPPAHYAGRPKVRIGDYRVPAQSLAGHSSTPSQFSGRHIMYFSGIAIIVLFCA